MTQPGIELHARRLMGLILALGLGLRLIAVSLDPPAHPDEYFQYLEPAWCHLTGLAQEAWEWRAGVRSWVLPFYNGAWMALLMRLGVPAGETLGWLLKAHWALINLSVVVIAFRGGASVSRRLQRRRNGASAKPPSGCEGGLLAAAACAAFPVLVSYAGHTLSELPAMLCMVAGLVLTCELLEDDEPALPAVVRKAALAGCLISLGACLRIAIGPLALVAPAWLLARRRVRPLAALLAGALVPALVFGLVDMISWGTFASSFIGYVNFNFIEGRAAEYGTEPATWYLEAIDHRARLALPLLLVPALLALRATWPFMVSALGLLAYLSMLPHKEERFIIAFWPFLLIAAGGAMGAFVARPRAGTDGGTPAATLWTRAASWSWVAWLIVVLAGGARQLRSNDEFVKQQDRLRALAWAGRQPDLRALIADTPFTGGAFWFGANAPQFMFAIGLADNPVITHALAANGSDQEKAALAAGFRVIHRVGEYQVLRRP